MIPDEPSLRMKVTNERLDAAFESGKLSEDEVATLMNSPEARDKFVRDGVPPGVIRMLALPPAPVASPPRVDERLERRLRRERSIAARVEPESPKSSVESSSSSPKSSVAPLTPKSPVVPVALDLDDASLKVQAPHGAWSSLEDESDSAVSSEDSVNSLASARTVINKDVFTVVEMPHDGHCLFRAIAFAVVKRNDLKAVKHVRKKLVEHFDRENYSELYTDSDGSSLSQLAVLDAGYDSVEAYLVSVLNTSSYGGSCELAGFIQAGIVKCPIHVWEEIVSTDGGAV
jgi:hypothetical protein